MAPKPKPKPKPKPSKPPPLPTRQETNEPPCEFTHPCTTSTSSNSTNTNTTISGNAPGNTSSGASSHPRKLISHIFGRNKTSTKLFPPHVWVHYCRKHYQRARYRARAWPFTQCDLLLDSLARMEVWGGVESFEVVLRRREVERLSSSSSSSSSQAPVKVGVSLRKGTRRGGTSASVSTSAPAYASGDDEEEEYGDEEAEAEEEESSSDGDGSKKKKKKTKKQKGRRRRPRIRACPVPEWLRAETGAGKSFAEIRAIVARIRADLTAQKAKGKSKEQVLFPDIEILPTFREWVLEKANEDGEGTKKMSRVSRKGAVQKVQR